MLLFTASSGDINGGGTTFDVPSNKLTMMIVRNGANHLGYSTPLTRVGEDSSLPAIGITENVDVEPKHNGTLTANILLLER